MYVNVVIGTNGAIVFFGAPHCRNHGFPMKICPQSHCGVIVAGEFLDLAQSRHALRGKRAQNWMAKVAVGKPLESHIICLYLVCIYDTFDIDNIYIIEYYSIVIYIYIYTSYIYICIYIYMKGLN